VVRIDQLSLAQASACAFSRLPNIAHMQKMKALLGWQNADGLDSRAQADACANEKPMKSQ
jgi:hypothetical protein